MFIASIFGRLSASVSEKIPMFFSELNPTLAVHKFKVTLCQKFLTETTDNNFTATARPKAQARAQPRALRSDPSTNQIARFVSTSNALVPNSNKYPLPNANEICQLLEMNIDTTSSRVITKPLLLRIKFELLVSYGTLQREVLKDPGWMKLVQESKFNNTLDIAFGPGGGEGGVYRSSLESIRNVW
jgi:hypothetical protein